MMSLLSTYQNARLELQHEVVGTAATGPVSIQAMSKRSEEEAKGLFSQWQLVLSKAVF